MSEEKQENKRTIKDFQREKRMRERITKKPDTQIDNMREERKKIRITRKQIRRVTIRERKQRKNELLKNRDTERL